MFRPFHDGPSESDELPTPRYVVKEMGQYANVIDREGIETPIYCNTVERAYGLALYMNERLRERLM